LKQNLKKWFSSQEDRERIRTQLGELQSTSKNFKKVLQGNLEQVSNTITPKVRPLIEIYSSVNYELTEAEFSENSVNDTWVQKFVNGLESLLKPFKSNLTNTNYDLLLHIIIQDIATRLEKALLQKKFNQLGGLQFDKDLRNIVTYFSTNSQISVRSEFARLTQMASLLNLEKVSEVLDYWGENSGPMTWRLTSGEVRRILSRRVDFSAAAIAALKL